MFNFMTLCELSSKLNELHHSLKWHAPRLTILEFPSQSIHPSPTAINEIKRGRFPSNKFLSLTVKQVAMLMQILKRTSLVGTALK